MCEECKKLTGGLCEKCFKEQCNETAIGTIDEKDIIYNK